MLALVYMLAWLFLLLSIGLGWAIVRQTSLHLRRLELLAMSVAIGLSLSAWIVFLCAKLLGFYIGLPIATLIIAVGLVIGINTPARYHRQTERLSKKWWWLLGLTMLATSFVIVRLLFLSYQFPDKTGEWTSNGNAWGDAPLHVTYVNQFAHGNTVDLVSPSYMRIPLTYPIISDFYSAILMRFGGDWTFVMLAPSVAMMLSLMYLIFSFGLRVLKTVRGAWLQFLMLFFSGSVQGGWRLSKVLLYQGLEGYHKFIGVSIGFAANDNYLNFFHSHPIPQRSYMFGMPLFIVAGTILLESYYKLTAQNGIAIPYLNAPKTTKWPGRKLLRTLWTRDSIIAGIIIGMMPLVHVHSFLVLVAVSVLAVILLCVRREMVPRQWLGAGIIGAVLAAPQIAWQFMNSFDGHFTKWISGWTLNHFAYDPKINFVNFWLGALGFLLIVMVFGALWLKDYKASKPIWLLYLAGIIIFAVCNVYVFQPSIWDNMKFFNYGFWFVMIVASFILTTWWQKRALRVPIILIVISMMLTGFYTLVLSGPKLTYQLLSKDEVAFGNNLMQELPANSFLLVGDRHNNPATMLSDRNVLMTFAGWYNLYDARWETVWRDRGIMLSGGNNASELIARYGLTHAVFSDADVYEGQVNRRFFESNYRLLDYQKGWWVFDLRQTP